MIRKILKNIVPLKVRQFIWPYRKQIKNFKILSKEYGQYRSMMSNESVGANKQSLPWMTYPAIEYLNQFNFKSEKVLEFGSGGSSIWWADRVQNLTCIEDNLEWYEKVQESLNNLPNVKCEFRKTDDEYSRLDFDSTPSIVVVDGSCRGKIVQNLIAKKEILDRECKLIIVDNSDWLPQSISSLSNGLNWIQVDFMGFAPINGYCHATTIFINPTKNIPRQKPIEPIGGVKKVFSFDHAI